MRKLRMYWNTNRKKILTIIGVLAFIIFIVHFINAAIYNQAQQEKNENLNFSKSNEEIGPTESIVDDGKISIQTAQDNTKIIKQFVEYCNKGDYQNAFNLLSSSCQKEVFNNNVNLFRENYCNKIFKTSRTYNTELWSTNGKRYTYQIKYYEDNLLATGGTSINTNTEDYITVIEENRENKLNINSFIYYEEINKTISKNDIEITVNGRKVYKTYEKYNITIKNHLTSTISISTKRDEKDIYLTDKNDAQYFSLLYEVPQNLLNIKPGYQSNIDVTFNKTYNSYRETEKIIFQSIVLNYEGYISNTSKETEKVTISVKI